MWNRAAGIILVLDFTCDGQWASSSTWRATYGSGTGARKGCRLCYALGYAGHTLGRGWRIQMDEATTLMLAGPSGRWRCWRSPMEASLFSDIG